VIERREHPEPAPLPRRQRAALAARDAANPHGRAAGGSVAMTAPGWRDEA
jgi:hypothetical protein